MKADRFLASHIEPFENQNNFLVFADPKVTYVPPPPPDDENSIFAHYQTGINFDKYDNILVEVSGLDPPPAILVSECLKFLRKIKS